ncbi:anti-sigma factor family protein [Cellulosilyticum sp. I15G10I2]|uniref:anti-sigma factor family protein n=1 Tax=Cellulosilyticum sp. I15G10I2 TaxID=1892843 RepID=UPI00085C9F8A|nr:zf-HC2 domain-containing protein [Cellulosilyticum sp. I15G10I2]
MKCHECIEQLSAYIDHMLTPEEQKELERHLESCQSCQEELKALIEIVESIAALEDVEIPETLHEDIMKSIHEDKESIKKNVKLKTWMKYVASTAAALLIVVILLDGSQILQHKKSSLTKTESASEEQIQDNMMLSNDTQMKEYKASQEADAADNPPEQSIAIAQNRDITSELTEVWEVISLDKVKTVELISAYITTYELQAMYLPDESNPTSIIIYQINNKNELFNSIKGINNDIKISKEEPEGENLEIIIK